MDRLIRGRENPQVSHYYAARLTDANFLRVSAEHERDLFYRGVGFFNAPMTVTMDSGDTAVTLSTRNVQPLTGVFVLSIWQAGMRYEKIDRVAPNESVTIELGAKPFTELEGTRERIIHDMEAVLVQQGLYVKEAQAMVNTWADQWFAEEGTRVLYLLPREWTDTTLPLDIKPRPDGIVRVMVGCGKMITPSNQRELHKQIVAYRSGDAASKLEAVDSVRKLALGRFLTPAIQKALGPSEDGVLVKAAYELATQANQLQPRHAVARSDGSAAGR